MATTVKTTTTFLMADVECSPNEETLQAMRDAEEGKDLEKVGKAEDLMKLLE